MKKIILLLFAVFTGSYFSLAQEKKKMLTSGTKLEALKKEVLQKVESRKDFTQQINDQIFSFAELGFQEYETSKLLTGILEKNGFTVERGKYKDKNNRQ
jgi:aminobenzoyl-glutamate utilization protein B